MSLRLGSSALGTEALAGTHEWAVITLAITSPGPTVTASSVTATWTYANSLGYAQAAWRVRLLTPLGYVLDDTGWMSGTDLTHTPAFVLSGNSSYVLEVSVRDTDTQVATVETTFTCSEPPTAALVNEAVGKLWDVAINGVGYMLVKGEQNVAWARQTVTLDAPRFATQDTSLSGSIERYSFLSNPDLSGGQGQIEGDRDSSSPTRYRDGWGVDPFTTPGVVELLPATTEQLATTYGALRMVVVGGSLYALTGAKALTYLTTPGGAYTALSVAAAGTISDLCTDGAAWYACDGTAVWRGTTSDPGAAWSTENVAAMCWAGSRIVGAKIGTGSKPNILITIADTGTIEDTVLTLPPDQTITGLAPGGAYVYFSAYAGNVGAIYAWTVGSTDAPRVVWNLPAGESPRELFWYQGQLLVRASRNGKAVIYRCPTSNDGSITPFLLAEPLDTVDDANPSTFTARGRFVYWGWSNMDGDGTSGVGIIDLSTGGWCKGIAADDTGGTSVATELWQGRIVLGVRGVGIYAEDPTTKVDSGWYTTSVRDGGSAHTKVWDELTLQTRPLTDGASVTAQYSLDRGSSFVNVSDELTMSGNGESRKTVDLNVVSSNISWLVTLNGGGAQLTMVQTKAHVIGLADTLLVLPIDARDDVRTLTGSQAGRQRGSGVSTVRQLEALAQSRVVVQDIDWPWTGLVESYEVLKVEVQQQSLRDRTLGKQDVAFVATVTMRRALR